MAVRKTRAPARRVESALTADDVPVTAGMLAEVRSELLSRIDQTKLELRAEIQEVKAELVGIKADVARLGFLIEEQNARNKIVLDALAAFIDRQARVEHRMDVIEETVRGLASGRSPG